MGVWVKKLFPVSVVLNVLLILAVVFLIQSNDANFDKAKYIDHARLEDLKIMENLVVRRLSKEDATAALCQYEDYFFKPEDNGIGVGYLFLVFDNNDILTRVEAHSFEGP